MAVSNFETNSMEFNASCISFVAAFQIIQIQQKKITLKPLTSLKNLKGKTHMLKKFPA